MVAAVRPLAYLTLPYLCCRCGACKHATLSLREIGVSLREATKPRINCARAWRWGGRERAHDGAAARKRSQQRLHVSRRRAAAAAAEAAAGAAHPVSTQVGL